MRDLKKKDLDLMSYAELKAVKILNNAELANLNTAKLRDFRTEQRKSGGCSKI